MTILVTGGAGFIGSNFVLDWLAQSDETIVNLDKLTYAGNLAEPGPAGWRRRACVCARRFRRRALVDRLLAEHRPRAIVNFAAESHVDRSIHGPGEFIQTNIVGTFHLLESVRAYWGGSGGCSRAFRLLHVSTDEVYGSLAKDDPAFTETHRYEPNSPYSASKAASDHLVRAYHHTYGLPVLTTNCSNNYGPLHFPEKLIPLMIVNALAGKPLPVYGDGQQIRDWLYVKDHCSAIRRVLEAGRSARSTTWADGTRCPTWTSCTPCVRCWTSCARARTASPTSDADHLRDRPPGHDRRYAIDARKIEQELGWKRRPRPLPPASARRCSGTWTTRPGWPMCRVAAYRDWIDKQYGTQARRMKILLLGRNGQVGWELQRSLAVLGELVALDFDAAGNPQGLCGDLQRHLAGWPAPCAGWRPT
jgi:dTDP-glucose 4,6-dehydratase